MNSSESNGPAAPGGPGAEGPEVAGDGTSRRVFLRNGLAVAGSVGLSSAVLAACGDGGSDSATAGSTSESTTAQLPVPGVDPKSVGKKHIAYVAIFQGNENAGRIGDGIKEEADKGGWTVDIVDGGGDVNKVQQQWQAILQKGVDGIISVQIDTKTWGPQIAEASDKKVPYIATFSDWRPGVTAAIGTNGGADGSVLAQYIIDRSGGKGRGLVISSEQFSSLYNRRRAFEAAVEPYPELEAIYHEMKLPAYQQDAFETTTAMLAKYPEGELDWIYGAFDEVGVAAAQACVAKGRDDVYVAANDGASAAIKMIQEGKPFQATTAPLFEKVGANAVRQLAQVMTGKPPLGQVCYIDWPFVDKYNVGDGEFFEGPAWSEGNVFTYWRPS